MFKCLDKCNRCCALYSDPTGPTVVLVSTLYILMLQRCPRTPANLIHGSMAQQKPPENSPMSPPLCPIQIQITKADEPYSRSSFGMMFRATAGESNLAGWSSLNLVAMTAIAVGLPNFCGQSCPAFASLVARLSLLWLDIFLCASFGIFSSNRKSVVGLEKPAE